MQYACIHRHALRASLLQLQPPHQGRCRSLMVGFTTGEALRANSLTCKQFCDQIVLRLIITRRQTAIDYLRQMQPLRGLYIVICHTVIPGRRCRFATACPGLDTLSRDAALPSSTTATKTYACRTRTIAGGISWWSMEVGRWGGGFSHFRNWARKNLHLS